MLWLMPQLRTQVLLNIVFTKIPLKEKFMYGWKEYADEPFVEDEWNTSKRLVKDQIGGPQTSVWEG